MKGMKSMFGPAVKRSGRMWGWLSTLSHSERSADLKLLPRWYTTLSAMRMGHGAPSNDTSFTVPWPPCTDFAAFRFIRRIHGYASACCSTSAL